MSQKSAPECKLSHELPQAEVDVSVFLFSSMTVFGGIDLMFV